MKKTGTLPLAAISAAFASALATGAANADDLTLCWAAWDPANALI